MTISERQDRPTHYNCCCKREEKNTIVKKKEKVVSMSVLSMVLHLLDYVGQIGFKCSDITAAKTICTIQWSLNSLQKQVTISKNVSCIKNMKYIVKFCKYIK